MYSYIPASHFWRLLQISRLVHHHWDHHWSRKWHHHWSRKWHHKKICGIPTQPNTQSIPPPNPSLSLLPSSIFSVALLVYINFQLPTYGSVDSYVDNLIGVCLNIGDNTIRSIRAILLSIYLTTRPLSSSQTSPINILHEFILSTKKWIAKGIQEEIKTVVGWRLNTRRFIV